MPTQNWCAWPICRSERWGFRYESTLYMPIVTQYQCIVIQEILIPQVLSSSTVRSRMLNLSFVLLLTIWFFVQYQQWIRTWHQPFLFSSDLIWISLSTINHFPIFTLNIWHSTLGNIECLGNNFKATRIGSMSFLFSIQSQFCNNGPFLLCS